MAELLDKVILYNVLYPLESKPDLDEVEIFVIRRLQKGDGMLEIEKQLQLPVKPILETLVDKKVLRRDFTLEGAAATVKAENIILLYDVKEGLFYNGYLYPNELKLQNDCLGFYPEHSFIDKQNLAWIHIFDRKECFYRLNGERKKIRRLTSSVFEVTR